MPVKKSLLMVVPLIICLAAPALAQDQVKMWQSAIADKERQITSLDSEIDQLQQDLQIAANRYDESKQTKTNKKAELDRAKDAYERGSKNVDIISPEDLVQLLKDYQTAEKEYRASVEAETQAADDRKMLEDKIERLKKRKSEQELGILEVKAKMFDEEMARPVWAEGYGEAILAEDKTMRECKKLALEYAKRDAMERGGKAIIESITEIKEFRLIKDVLKSKANVSIVDQDNTGDFGDVIRVNQADMIKFTAKVRLKLQGTGAYNPYREKIGELGGGGKKKIEKKPVEPSSNPTNGKSVTGKKTEKKNEVKRPPVYNGQTWKGHYVCAQGNTELTLTVTSVSGKRVKAIFNFNVPNRKIYGSYYLSGSFDERSRQLKLDPDGWIRKPGLYFMVGMDGKISSNGKSYTGKITHRSCKDFSLWLSN